MSYVACARCSRPRESGSVYCAQHRHTREAAPVPRKYASSPNRNRDPFLESTEWRFLSARFRERYPICMACGKEKSQVVDHILPRKKRPDLALDEGNWQALCRRCDVWKSNKERGGWAHDFRRSVKKRFSKGEHWSL